jgi:hypothetical protein
MKSIAFTPKYNTPGLHDATGAFQPEARSFAKIHGGVVVQVDNHATKQKMRESVIETLRNMIEQPTLVAFFCHGWRTGIQLGFSSANVAELVPLFGISPAVALYACSAGDGAGVGGDGGFADSLRDALCRDGNVFCQVDAHTTSGHCSRNPYVRRFEGMGSSVGGAGGYYIVTPRSEQWPAWKRALMGDLRLRFPTMSVASIHAELAAS